MLLQHLSFSQWDYMIIFFCLSASCYKLLPLRAKQLPRSDDSTLSNIIAIYECVIEQEMNGFRDNTSVMQLSGKKKNKFLYLVIITAERWRPGKFYVSVRLRLLVKIISDYMRYNSLWNYNWVFLEKVQLLIYLNALSLWNRSLICSYNSLLKENNVALIYWWLKPKPTFKNQKSLHSWM